MYDARQIAGVLPSISEVSRTARTIFFFRAAPACSGTASARASEHAQSSPTIRATRRSRISRSWRLPGRAVEVLPAPGGVLSDRLHGASRGRMDRDLAPRGRDLERGDPLPVHRRHGPSAGTRVPEIARLPAEPPDPGLLHSLNDRHSRLSGPPFRKAQMQEARRYAARTLRY